MAPHSSTLAWKIPWTEEPGRLQSMGSLRVGQDWATSLSLFTFLHWRRKWQPTPVFLPGESQGQGSLVGCHLWDHRVGHDWSDLAAAAVVFILTKMKKENLKGSENGGFNSEEHWCVLSGQLLEQRDQWTKKKKKKVDAHRELRVREFGQVISIITDEEWTWRSNKVNWLRVLKRKLV